MDARETERERVLPLPLSFISLNTDISDVLDQIDREPSIRTPSEDLYRRHGRPRTRGEDDIEEARRSKLAREKEREVFTGGAKTERDGI